MIEHMKPTDSIFDSGAEALVCPVNCVGVMGAGLAKEFAQRFNGFYAAYQYALRYYGLNIGKVDVWFYQPCNVRLVSFPTKVHWANPSYIQLVKDGLKSLVSEIKIHNLSSLAIPALGCGLGGLDWNDVRPLIEEAFKDLPDVRVMLYPPKEKE